MKTIPKIKGGEKVTDDRTHWIDETIHKANWTPGYKFNDVDVTKYKQDKIKILKIKDPDNTKEKREMKMIHIYYLYNKKKIMKRTIIYYMVHILYKFYKMQTLLL